MRSILRRTATEELIELEKRLRQNEDSGQKLMTHEQFLTALRSVGVGESKEDRDIVLIYAIRQSDTFLEIEF